MPRMTYFLSPGPRSWMDKPGMSPAISMMPEAPALCSASPESAWIDAGVSNTLVAFSLLAVTTTSPSSAVSGAAGASAATATPADRMLATEIAMIREPLLFGTFFRPLVYVARRKRLIVVIDTRIVAGTDDTHDIDAVRRCGFQRMQLLPRQEDDISRADAGLLIFRPHITFPVQHDDRLFIEMAMRCGLRRRYVFFVFVVVV